MHPIDERVLDLALPRHAFLARVRKGKKELRYNHDVVPLAWPLWEMIQYINKSSRAELYRGLYISASFCRTMLSISRSCSERKTSRLVCSSKLGCCACSCCW